MQRGSSHPRSPVKYILLVGLVILLSIFFSFPFSMPNSAFADAGGFPTATRTVTPTTTATVPPTLAPTATFTSLPTITLVVVLPATAISTPTVIVTQPDNSIFACWPLAIVFILVGVVIAAYLLTRRARLEGQE